MPEGGDSVLPRFLPCAEVEEASYNFNKIARGFVTYNGFETNIEHRQYPGR